MKNFSRETLQTMMRADYARHKSRLHYLEQDVSSRAYDYCLSICQHMIEMEKIAKRYNIILEEE